jgi:hypothetical protein
MRQLLTAATAAVVVAGGVGATAATATAAPPTPVTGARTYVVLYEKGASFTSAEHAIRRAGGRIIRSNRAVGLATVMALGKGFAKRARAQRALVGAARTAPSAAPANGSISARRSSAARTSASPPPPRRSPAPASRSPRCSGTCR